MRWPSMRCMPARLTASASLMAAWQGRLAASRPSSREVGSRILNMGRSLRPDGSDADHTVRSVWDEKQERFAVLALMRVKGAEGASRGEHSAQNTQPGDRKSAEEGK